jgi:putative hydroxymethylpyrimidine transport system substrate-binding protein
MKDLPMNRRTLLAAAGLAGLLLASPAVAAEKFTVVLDWFVNPDHAPLVIAKEKGFFAAEGLDVELIEPADPASPPRFVAAGQADAAVSYQPSLQLAVKEGLPLVRFATLVETPLNTLIALADGPIKTPKDLKGKKIGFSAEGLEDAILVQILESAGLKRADVELINVNFALTAALISKQVDAVIGGYRNFELTEIELAGRKAVAFYPEELGVPPYDELVLIAAAKNAGDVRLGAFTTAMEKAAIWLTNHPAEGWESFKKAYPKLDDELNRRAFTDTLPRFAKRPAALDVNRYARFGEFLKAKGLVDTLPPVETYAIVPKLAK